MRGKKAKQLRKAARTLGLTPETRYSVDQRRVVVDTHVDEAGVKHPVYKTIYGSRRMQACQRKAYKEAKKIYAESRSGLRPR